MAVRTARLASGSTGAAGVTHTAYVCPAGHTAIVKTVHVSNGSGSAASLILAAQSGTAIVNLFVGSIAVNEVRSLTVLYLVMEPGDEFLINCSGANAAKYWLSGVELVGVA